MAKTLGQIIKEADEIIEQGLRKKAEPVSADYSDDFVGDLAKSLLAEEGTLKQASAPEAEDAEELVMTAFEKIAGAVAILDTVANLGVLSKMASFEEHALAAGHTPEEIDTFLEKSASQVEFHSLAAQLFG